MCERTFVDVPLHRDRDWLASELAVGRSYETIAVVAGVDPSTVAYWARRFDLVSSFGPRHAARGGLVRGDLEPLIAEGLSVRAIAAQLDRSTGTVRHWLRQYGLSTVPSRRTLVAVDDAMLECPRHGLSPAVRRSDGGLRCGRCRVDAVTKRRREVKRQLVEDAGGACVRCGYRGSPAALQFHHVDPATKRFSISRSGISRALASARAEAAKCVLLCANCHAEVEAGAAMLPAVSPGPPG